ncbi:hypothetical protein [Phaeobacter inhibens]|uniref:hypothetical protein n=1 Tax=Phaeobacter inhibens TaxID=221822 RepID=UPI00295F3A3D|nr:hypothetical protein [Phaeobacter inhibens]
MDGLNRDQLAALPTGRRWLYLAMDCATRCVVGMRLAVQPSSEDAIALLSDVTRDKTDLAIAAGCKSAWAHYGGLKTVATDLGIAFVDDSFRTAIFDVHGSPETPTGGLPQLRARVERIFGTFGTNLLPGLAGRTFSNPKEKGDYPSREMASIADDALIQMLILYVVDVYHNRPHRGLQGETPNNCWKRLAMEKGVVPDVPERVHRRAFGKLLRRRVTGRGVRVFGIDLLVPRCAGSISIAMSRTWICGLISTILAGLWLWSVMNGFRHRHYKSALRAFHTMSGKPQRGSCVNGIPLKLRSTRKQSREL